jgi:hypothetical protein
MSDSTSIMAPGEQHPNKRRAADTPHDHHNSDMVDAVVDAIHAHTGPGKKRRVKKAQILTPDDAAKVSSKQLEITEIKGIIEKCKLDLVQYGNVHKAKMDIYAHLHTPTPEHEQKYTTHVDDEHRKMKENEDKITELTGEIEKIKTPKMDANAVHENKTKLMAEALRKKETEILRRAEHAADKRALAAKKALEKADDYFMVKKNKADASAQQALNKKYDTNLEAIKKKFNEFFESRDEQYEKAPPNPVNWRVAQPQWRRDEVEATRLVEEKFNAENKARESRNEPILAPPTKDIAKMCLDANVKFRTHRDVFDHLSKDPALLQIRIMREETVREKRAEYIAGDEALYRRVKEAHDEAKKLKIDVTFAKHVAEVIQSIMKMVSVCNTNSLVKFCGFLNDKLFDGLENHIPGSTMYRPELGPQFSLLAFLLRLLLMQAVPKNVGITGSASCPIEVQFIFIKNQISVLRNLLGDVLESIDLCILLDNASYQAAMHKKKKVAKERANQMKRDRKTRGDLLRSASYEGRYLDDPNPDQPEKVWEPLVDVDPPSDFDPFETSESELSPDDGDTSEPEPSQRARRDRSPTWGRISHDPNPKWGWRRGISPSWEKIRRSPSPGPPTRRPSMPFTWGDPTKGKKRKGNTRSSLDCNTKPRTPYTMDTGLLFV